MSSTHDRAILKRYIPLVKFLADVLGPHYEIVLHDYTHPKRSVIAIENGHLSGRRIGSPMTDLALRQTVGQLLKFADGAPAEPVGSDAAFDHHAERPHPGAADSEGGEADGLSNYYAKSDSGRILKASTFTIRNDAGQVIGSLCINMDIEPYEQIFHWVEQLSGLGGRPNGDHRLGEFLTDSSETAAKQLMGRILETLKPANEMTTKEKHQVIKRFYEEGLFQFKGTVTPAAHALNLSPATVYRHVAGLKKKAEAETHWMK